MREEYPDGVNDGRTELKEAICVFYVAGVKFHQLKTCIDEVEVGMYLTMTPEPENKFDPNAVSLEFASLEQTKNIMVGYVPAKMSASVTASLMIKEHVAEVIEVNKDAKTWEQLKVAIKEA